MKFDIRLNDEDYIQFNYFLMEHSKAARQAVTMGRFLGPAIALLIMIVLVLARADKWLIMVEAAFLIVFSLVTFFTYPKMAKKKIRKNILKLKEEGELPYVKHTTLEFREDDIFEERDDGTRVSPYKDFISLHDTEDYIYIRKGAQEAIVLPKKCLQGKDKELFSFLKGKINAAAEE